MDSSLPVEVRGLGGSAVDVAAGGGHACARRADGALACWGWDERGQLGDGTNTESPVPLEVSSLGSDVLAVDLGDGHSCALRGDGTLSCWGWNRSYQIGDGTQSDRWLPVAVIDISQPIVQSSLGSRHTCARAADGSVYCWGFNGAGMVGVGDDSVYVEHPVSIARLGHDVAEVSLGNSYGCARKTDGSLWCWGHVRDSNSDLNSVSYTSSVPTRLMGPCP